MSKNITFREYERSNNFVKNNPILKIARDKIYVEAGFNRRDLTKPSTVEKIQRIKEAYKTGKYVKPLEVKLIGEGAFIVDGECRLTAANLAFAEGAENLEWMSCVPFTGNDTAQLVHMIAGNDGEKLTPLETAEVVRAMANLGCDNAMVAKELNYSLSWVEKLLYIASLPQKIKFMVSNDKISLDVAVAAYKKEGAEAIVSLEAKVEGSTQKVTAKHVKLPNTNKLIVTAAKELATKLPNLGQFALSSDEEVHLVRFTGAAIKALILLQNELTGTENDLPSNASN